MSLRKELTVKYNGKVYTKNINEYINQSFHGFSVLVSIKIRRFELSTDNISFYDGIRFVVFDFGNNIKIKVSVSSETRFGIDYVVIQPSRYELSAKHLVTNLTNTISRMEVYGIRIDKSRVNLELKPGHTLDVSMKFYTTNNGELNSLISAKNNKDELAEQIGYIRMVRKSFFEILFF